MSSRVCHRLAHSLQLIGARLALAGSAEGTGFLVSSDQVAGGTRLKLYRREGTAGSPHHHPEVLNVVTQSDDTDGLEVTPRALPGFPRGVLVMMNSGPKNFLLYDWREIDQLISRPTPSSPSSNSQTAR